MLRLEVSISTQMMQVVKGDKISRKYYVSTAKNGAGEERDSYKTPRGWHIIRAKIGAHSPLNTVFVARRATGEIYTASLREKYPGRDWILTRILWLSGLEVGKNRLGKVDTMQRYIYIHGTPDEVPMGTPGSKGCIRMNNLQLIELFDMVPLGTKVLIKE